MSYFTNKKEDDLPRDALPSPSIWVPSTKLKQLFERFLISFAGDLNRPLILQVRMGDRYEIYARFMKLVEEKPRLGHIRFVDSTEVHCVLADTNPYPTVIIDGDNPARGKGFPTDVQEIYVELLKRQRDLTPRIVVLTERDPGELYQEGRWLDEFRQSFHQTLRWPPLAERHIGEIANIVNAFMQFIRRDLKDRHDIDFAVKKGGVELFSEALLGLNPECVHNLWNASKRVVDAHLAVGQRMLSGTSLKEILLKSDSWEKLTANHSKSAVEVENERIVPPA